MLQYASLKAVLQYLDANIRFQIYNSCPSIRQTERIVPLYINRLKFVAGVNGPNRVDVNSTTYSIGTIRIYPSGVKLRKEHDVENSKGGVESDLDKFGFTDYTSDTHLTPILIGRPRTTWQLDDYQIDILVREFEAIDMLLALKRGGKPYILDRQHPRFYILQQFENQSIEEIRKYVRSRRLLFLPYLNRRNNITVPYTTEVQMTVTDETENVYRYPGKKLYQVEKKLLKLFFGSKKLVYVKYLEINDAKMFRFPVDTFIKIQHLYVFSYTFQMLDAISRFVHPMSLPLETIEFRNLEENELHHDIVKSTKKLIILGCLENMRTVLEVATQKVEFERPGFEPEDYLILARNWLRTHPTVDTCYVFNFEKRYEVAEVLRLLKTKLNAEAVGAECLKAQINDTSKLKIAYQKVEGKWRMQFKVILE